MSSSIFLAICELDHRAVAQNENWMHRLDPKTNDQSACRKARGSSDSEEIYGYHVIVGKVTASVLEYSTAHHHHHHHQVEMS